MPFYRKTDFRAWVLAWMLLFLGGVAQAGGIVMQDAKVQATREGYFLDAHFDLPLTPVLESALTHGVPLTFTLIVEVTEPRWYWFNKEVYRLRQERRISFNPLTREYRFTIGSLYLSFSTLDDALKALAQVSHQPFAAPGVLVPGHHYNITAQLKLDVSLLPKPFQVDALSSDDWNLQSTPWNGALTP